MPYRLCLIICLILAAAVLVWAGTGGPVWVDDTGVVTNRLPRWVGGRLLGLSGLSDSGTLLSATIPLQAPLRDNGGQVVNVMAHGAVGNGVVDDTAAIQAAINAVPSQGGTVLFPCMPGDYKITNTLIVRSRHGIRLVGSCGTGASTTAPILDWDGANGGTALWLDHTRDAEVWNLTIRARTGTLDVGLDIDMSGAGTGISSNNQFHNVTITSSGSGRILTYGVRIAFTAVVNDELHKFHNLHISGTAGQPTYGVWIGHAQSKKHLLIAGSINQATYGVYVVAGSYSAIGLNYSLNTIDNYVESPTDNIVLRDCQSETAQRFLLTGGPSGGSWPILIEGGTLNPEGRHADGNYILYRHRGPLVLQSNDFASGTQDAAWRVSVTSSGDAVATSIGNTYPNATPFTGPQSRIHSIGDTYRSTGVDVPLDTALNGPTSFGGHLVWGTDNTFDVGASGATRPRTGYFGTSVVTPAISIGASGTSLTQVRIYTPTLDPASVSASTTAEQTYSVTGLTTADTVTVNKPSHTSACGIVGVRVSAADTLAITWGNFSAASACDPPSEVYRLVAVRS